MTILSDILKSERYRIPESFFKPDSPFSIEFQSDERRQTGDIFIYDNDRQIVFEAHLPEHYLESMLIEYVHGCLNALRGNAKNDLVKIQKELTHVPKERYTCKDDEIDYPNRPLVDGDAPAMQPGGVVDALLDTAAARAAQRLREARRPRPVAFQATRALRNDEVRWTNLERTPDGGIRQAREVYSRAIAEWTRTGEERIVPADWPPVAPINPAPDVRPPEQPAPAGQQAQGVGQPVDLNAIANLWRQI
jgi:hypothetical protein